MDFNIILRQGDSSVQKEDKECNVLCPFPNYTVTVLVSSFDKISCLGLGKQNESESSEIMVTLT